MINRINNTKALYVHVPFCEKLCAYCDFPKMLFYTVFADKYLTTLRTELADCGKYDSIYIGGGTPTSLSLEQFKTLLQMVSSHLEPKASFCVEVNPENCQEEKISLMKQYGVNRVSIGVQTFDSHQLGLLQRNHTPNMVISLVESFHKLGINNLSCDLIYGLPGQTIANLKTDLDLLLQMDIPHISTYPLTIEKHTAFSLQGVQEASQEKAYQFFRYINKGLKKHGYLRYEISNFSKPGYESQHNLIYWKNQSYRGVGPGASGYEKNVRYKNSSNFTQYFHGNIQRQEEVVSDKDYLFEYVMLGLRLKKGISLNEFQSIFGQTFQEIFHDTLPLLLEKKLLIIQNKSVRMSEKGTYIENYILINLLKNL